MSADFKQFGTMNIPIISDKCNDHLLADKSAIYKLLEKKKEVSIQQEQNIILKPQPVPYNKNMPDRIVDMDPFAINRNLRSKGKYYSSTTGKTYANYAAALKDPSVKAAASKK